MKDRVIVQAWTPRELADSLSQEARRRLCTKSAIIRLALAKELNYKEAPRSEGQEATK